MEQSSSNTFFKPIYNYGEIWTEYQAVWAKGYAFMPSGELLEGRNLAIHLKKILSSNNFLLQLKDLNGRFAAAGCIQDQQFLLTDRTRSYPLYYSTDKEKTCGSDSADFLINKDSFIEKQAEKQFLSTGFVWGENTLISNIKQCEPGSIVLINNSTIQKKLYFRYAIQETIKYTEKEAIKKLLTILDHAMKRSLQIIGDKPISIPLTSGYDSRFLTAWLKEHRNKNIKSFTCGTKDSFEFINAEKVSGKLDLPWQKIFHDGKTLKETLPTGKTLEEFLDYSCGAASMTFFQDVPSMIKMNLPKDTVVVGGHSADFLAGSHLWPFQNFMPSSTLISHASKRMTPYSSQLKTSYDIEKILKEAFIKHKEDIPYSIIEDFDFSGRQCKYIINSTRTYDFFAGQTVLPFLDNEVVDFFRSLPFHLKIRKKIYDKTLKRYFFGPLGLNFEKEFQATWYNQMRQLIKFSIPSSFSEFYTSSRKIQDTCNYRTIVRMLSQKEPTKERHPNEYLFKWYVDYLKNKIS